MIRLATSERAIHRLYRAGESLHLHERCPFSGPMVEVLAKTVVTNTKAYLAMLGSEFRTS